MNIDNLSEREVEIFRLGMKAGVWLYAHYKDGVQYVGTTGGTLKEAYQALEYPKEYKPETGMNHLLVGIAIADDSTLPER